MTYTVHFRASSSGGGLAAGHSTITLTAPTGTFLPTNVCNYTVTDTTTLAGGNCPAVSHTSGNQAIITVPPDVAPLDDVVGAR